MKRKKIPECLPRNSTLKINMKLSKDVEQATLSWQAKERAPPSKVCDVTLCKTWLFLLEDLCYGLYQFHIFRHQPTKTKMTGRVKLDWEKWNT